MTIAENVACDQAYVHVCIFVRAQISEPNFTVTMQSGDSVIVDGRFVPAAVVTVISDSKLPAESMLEMRAGVSAAFRCVYAWCTHQVISM